MKYNHIKRSFKSPIYVSFKKHYCPDCNEILEKIRISKIVNSSSKEAENFDFQMGDTYMVGNVKFIWTAFRCPVCGRQFSVVEMRRMESV